MPEHFIQLLAAIIFFGGSAYVGWYRKRANNQINTGKYTEGINAYSKFLRFNKRDKYALYRRGWGYARLENWDAAISDFDKYIKISPRDFGAYLSRGIIHTKQGNFDAAFRDFNQSILLYPTSAQAHLNRADLWILSNEDYDAAIQDYTKAIGLLIEELAKFRRFTQRYTEEGDQEIQNTIIHAYNERGETYAKDTKFDDAIDDYNQALKFKTKSFSYILRTNRALAYWHKKDYNSALNDFNTLLVEFPEGKLVLSLRAGLHFQMKNYEAAIEDYIALVRLFPDNDEYSSSLAGAYLKTKQYDLALEHYDRAISLKADDISLWIARGSAYYDMADYTRCIADCNQVLALEPDNPIGYINRAEAQFALGDYPQALADYQKAQSLDSTANLITAGIAITRFKLGEAVEARQLWSVLVQEDGHFTDMTWIEKELHWAKPLVEAAQQLLAEGN